jgi:hypothetical protein
MGRGAMSGRGYGKFYTKQLDELEKAAEEEETENDPL